MTETIEQLVVRLVCETHDLPNATSLDTCVALAKACMLHQAKVDADLCNAISAVHRTAYKRGTRQERANPYYDGKSDGACECADDILKSVGGLK